MIVQMPQASFQLHSGGLLPTETVLRLGSPPTLLGSRIPLVHQNRIVILRQGTRSINLRLTRGVHVKRIVTKIRKRRFCLPCTKGSWLALTQSSEKTCAICWNQRRHSHLTGCAGSRRCGRIPKEVSMRILSREIPAPWRLHCVSQSHCFGRGIGHCHGGYFSSA